MKYRIDSNGAYIFHDFGEHSVNEAVWKDADDKFEKRVDGTYYNYYNEDGSVNLILEGLKTEEQLKAEAKAETVRQLETLTVTTTNGNTFDANNQARLDMQNAITASDFLGVTQTTWRMADDSEVLIELSELKEALALAIQKYAQLKGIG